MTLWFTKMQKLNESKVECQSFFNMEKNNRLHNSNAFKTVWSHLEMAIKNGACFAPFAVITIIKTFQSNCLNL